jgi:hypothetical protein
VRSETDQPYQPYAHVAVPQTLACQVSGTPLRQPAPLNAVFQLFEESDFDSFSRHFVLFSGAILFQVSCLFNVAAHRECEWNRMILCLSSVFGAERNTI